LIWQGFALAEMASPENGKQREAPRQAIRSERVTSVGVGGGEDGARRGKKGQEPERTPIPRKDQKTQQQQKTEGGKEKMGTAGKGAANARKKTNKEKRTKGQEPDPKRRLDMKSGAGGLT